MKSVFGGMQKLNTSNLQHYYVRKTTAVFWCFSTDQTTLESINKLNKCKLGFAISILSTSLSRKQIKSVWGKTSSWSTNEVEVKISPSVFILSFGSQSQIQNKNEFYLSFPSSFNNVPFHWRSGETSLCFFLSFTILSELQLWPSVQDWEMRDSTWSRIYVWWEKILVKNITSFNHYSTCPALTGTCGTRRLCAECTNDDHCGPMKVWKSL